MKPGLVFTLGVATTLGMVMIGYYLFIALGLEGQTRWLVGFGAVFTLVWANIAWEIRKRASRDLNSREF